MSAASSPAAALPSPIRGTKANLSSVAQRRIKQLSGAQPRRFIWEIAQAWIVIVGAIATAVYVSNLIVSALAIVVVGTRQNVLGLMMHEQTHYLGIKHKYGDLITDFLACYPLIVLSVKNYSRVHLSHHKNYLHENDPDLIRKSGPDWIFPMQHRKLLKLFAKDIFGLTLLETIRGKNARSDTIKIRRLWEPPAAIRFLYFGSAISLITLMHAWPIVLLYWVLPLVTVMQVIVRWGAIREHHYVLNGALEETTPIIINPRWEEIVMPIKNFTLHIYHHYYPTVPFSNLPEVHQIFVDENLVNQEHVFHGSIDYLKSIVKRSNG